MPIKFCVLTCVAFLLVACGAADSGPASDAVAINDGWSRQPAEGQTVGVAYATVINGSDSDVRIVAASSSASSDVQLHETLMTAEGAMTMQEVEDFVVPAGGTFVFEPGGPHIMMMGIDAATYPTDTVDVTITFDDGTSRSFDAEVRAIAGGDMEDMEDMDHGDGHGG